MRLFGEVSWLYTSREVAQRKWKLYLFSLHQYHIKHRAGSDVGQQIESLVMTIHTPFKATGNSEGIVRVTLFEKTGQTSAKSASYGGESIGWTLVLCMAIWLPYKFYGCPSEGLCWLDPTVFVHNGCANGLLKCDNIINTKWQLIHLKWNSKEALAYRCVLVCQPHNILMWHWLIWEVLLPRCIFLYMLDLIHLITLMVLFQ